MWLVLGGSGQLGQSLKEVLAQSGIEHIVVGRNEVDITHQSNVESFLKTTQPTVVVNCAAWTAVDAAEDHVAEANIINNVGTRHIAIASRKNNARLFHVSTDYVFPGTSNKPYAEHDATGPVSVYGKSKLAGEQAIQNEHPENSLIIRTAWLYSQYQANFVKTMVRKALQTAPVRVVSDQLGQPTLATDLARHMIMLANHPTANGIFHGTNSGSTSWFGLTLAIYRALGVDEALVTPVPSSEYPTKATRPSNSVLSHQRTIDLGIPEMQNWEDALKIALPEITSTIENEK